MKIASIILFILFSINTNASEFFFEKDQSLPLVNINIALKGGSTQDPEGKNGVTDLMSRLILRGTKSKTKQQIDLTLDQLGGQLGTETRGEFMVIRGSVLSENLPAFLKLIEEILITPSFSQKEFEKLKKEQISNLMENLDNDQKLMRTKFDSIIFKGHPFSKINHGTIKDITSLTITDIQNQYKKIINQSRMLILASGDTEKTAFSAFQKKVDEKLNSNTQIDVIEPFKNYPHKIKVVLIDKPDRTQTQISIAQRGSSFTNPSLDAIQIGNFAFGGGTFLSKLMVELRVKRGWTYGAGSAFKMASQPHSWRVSFFPKNTDTPAAIKETLRLLTDLRDHGITQAEFEAAKSSMINSAGFNFNTPEKRIENLMVEKIFNLPEGYHKNFAKRISDISFEDVNQALKKFIEPDHVIIGLVATASITKAALAKELGIKEANIEIVDYTF